MNSSQSKKTDRTILRELEKIIYKPIPSVAKIFKDTVGVQFKGDTIIGLGLYQCGLTALPEFIGQLKALQILYLWHNELEVLPESLGELKSLTSLDLESNQLISLPESLGELKSLTSLDLESNQLISLPESLGELKSLQRLNLSGNPLISLPESFGQLKSLQELFLYNNQLRTLPESFTQLSNLVKLVINYKILGSPTMSILEKVIQKNFLMRIGVTFIKMGPSVLFWPPRKIPLPPY